MQVTILDILFLVILFFSSFFGVRSGATKLIIGLVFFVLSIWLTNILHPSFIEILSKYIKNESWINISSIICAYIIAVIFCGTISKLLKKMSDDSDKSFFDIFFGMTFGVIRGLLLSIIILLVIIGISTKKYEEAQELTDYLSIDKEDVPDWVTESISYGKMLEALDFVEREVMKDDRV